MTAQVTPARRTPPRKPSHWLRNASIGVIAVFVLLAALGSATRPPSTTGPTAPPDAGGADAGSFDPDASEVASPTPAGISLLSSKGTGPQTSDEFHASGDSVDVTYDFTCPAEDSFTVNFYGTNGSPVLPDVVASEFGVSGSNTVTENLNGETGPFTVEIDSPCAWSIEVLGAP